LKSFIGVTDKDWFKYLSSLPSIDEVNFWQPSGHQKFQALTPGELFLFKLHSPDNYIVGGGFFAYSNICPLRLAWEAFGEKNGAASLSDMRRRVEKYRGLNPIAGSGYDIGCILLEQPFFFHEEQWIPVPNDWSMNIVRGKGYDLESGVGAQLWNDVLFRLQARTDLLGKRLVAEPQPQYGKPVLIRPRLGQGSFRIIVTDMYQRRCAVTQERTLPVLEAAHIKPFSDNGPHIVENGLLLRSDIHKLFDTGYVTVTPEYKFEVSKRIRDEFENGRDYYALQGKPLYLPMASQQRPHSEFIKWHNDHVFRA